MNVKRSIIIPVLLVAVFSFLGADVRFDGLDLSADDTLLFSVDTDTPGFGTYSSLFSANLKSDTIDQITVFPEYISLVSRSSKLQIQNRFGIFRSDATLKAFKPLREFPSFVNGGEVKNGKIAPVQTSPDGNYLTFLEEDSAAYGTLKLFDVVRQKVVTVAERVELTLQKGAVSWSPDSDFFVYAKNNTIYYYSIENYRQSRTVTESLRKIGNGTTANVKWSPFGDLYYVSNSLIYRLRKTEFFTRSLYTELFESGRLVGKLPFKFNGNFDSFWISPDGTKVLFDKSGRNIFLYFLTADDYLSTGETMSLPYLLLPKNTRVKDVLWSEKDIITILTGSIENGADKSTIFRLDLTRDTNTYTFDRYTRDGVQQIVLTIDGEKAALVTTAGVIIKNYATWETKGQFNHPSPVQALWRTGEDLILAGEAYIEQINVRTGEAEILGLSQADSYGRSAEGRILASINGITYDVTGERPQPAGGAQVQKAKVSSASYRVYLENAGRGLYRNMVMIRNITGFGTTPLVPWPVQQYDPFPLQDEPVDFTSFSHGSRIRQREIALTFNAIDSVEGLTEILRVLSDYDIRATFFINGNFIRQHPEAVKEIAASGHEVGSLFYLYFNMTDARYRIDKEFIRQGLGRNEDDYFAVTGKELSLLWHAPYYFVNSDIISASRDGNYVYVGRDFDPLDWVPKTESAKASGLYISSAGVIERIMEKKQPGSIIGLRIGSTDPEREDYLFNRLDLLINSLLSEGYSMVPVSTLIEHSR